MTKEGMTASELEAIEARAAAAPRGPWRVGNVGEHHIDVDSPEMTTIAQVLERSAEGLIVAARADVPRLVAEVRRCKRQMDLLADEMLLADRYKAAMRNALNELGVPQRDYPAPVTNAVELLSQALRLSMDEKLEILGWDLDDAVTNDAKEDDK